MRPIDADTFKKYIDAQEGRPFIGCTVGEAMKILIDEQPTVQPEKTQHYQEGTTSDLISRQAVINAIENTNAKMSMPEWDEITNAVMSLPTIQPEPAILVAWIDKYIEWLKSFDNEFANLAAAHISVMVKKWRDEQNERTD